MFRVSCGNFPVLASVRKVFFLCKTFSILIFTKKIDKDSNRFYWGQGLNAFKLFAGIRVENIDCGHINQIKTIRSIAPQSSPSPEAHKSEPISVSMSKAKEKILSFQTRRGIS